MFNSMINEDKSGEESGVLKNLMSLQQKIDERKKEVDQKAARIKSKCRANARFQARCLVIRFDFVFKVWRTLMRTLEADWASCVELWRT